MESIKKYIETTELTLANIAKELGVSLKRVRSVWDKYPTEFKKNRKAANYRRSKLGEFNPMLGNTKERHPRYIGEVSDAKGYLMVLKPDWFTGRSKSKHVFTHHVVVCEHLNLTEIPKGWVVHHCDENKHNNSFDNLVLMTMGDHTRIHCVYSATTISKESTLKWVEAHGSVFTGMI